VTIINWKCNEHIDKSDHNNLVMILMRLRNQSFHACSRENENKAGVLNAQNNSVVLFKIAMKIKGSKTLV
jgi:hypothetical protein